MIYAHRAIVNLTAASYWFGLNQPLKGAKELYKAWRFAKLAKSENANVIFNLWLEASTWEATPMGWDQWLTDLRKGLM